MYDAAEQQEKKRLKAEEKRKKKWEDNEYVSSSIVLATKADEEQQGNPSIYCIIIELIVAADEMGYISDFSESEEEKDINYITGDATKPSRKGVCIIIKYETRKTEC